MTVDYKKKYFCRKTFKFLGEIVCAEGKIVDGSFINGNILQFGRATPNGLDMYFSEVIHGPFDDFTKLLSDVGAWHVKEFGPDCSNKRIARKLLEEAAEFSVAPDDAVEAADVLICLLAWAHRNKKDLIAEARAKFEIVAKRDQAARGASKDSDVPAMPVGTFEKILGYSSVPRPMTWKVGKHYIRRDGGNAEYIGITHRAVGLAHHFRGICANDGPHNPRSFFVDQYGKAFDPYIGDPTSVMTDESSENPYYREDSK